MKYVMISIFLLSCILSPSLSEDPNYKLEMIVELFRHGARTSITSLKGLEESYVKEIGAGKLTPNGMRQHEILGRQLSQKTYYELFKPPYSQYNAIMYSSGVIRAILSAQSHLAGLYPLGTGYNISVKQEETSKLSLSPILPPFKPIDIDKPTYETAFEGGQMLVAVKSNQEQHDYIFRTKDACTKGGK